MYTQTESAKTRGPRTEKKEPHCYEILPIRNETENKSIVSTNAHSATTTTTNPTSHGQKAKQQPYVDVRRTERVGNNTFSVPFSEILRNAKKWAVVWVIVGWFGGFLGGGG